MGSGQLRVRFGDTYFGVRLYDCLSPCAMWLFRVRPEEVMVAFAGTVEGSLARCND